MLIEKAFKINTKPTKDVIFPNPKRNSLLYEISILRFIVIMPDNKLAKQEQKIKIIIPINK